MSTFNRIKVSDFISEFLIKNGINTLFAITGGFAMHLNDSFGKNIGFNTYYQHHEQACGYAAIGYSKINQQPCVVCTTAGCGATNLTTPCMLAYQDSLPILFITGQVKSNETTRFLNNSKMSLRHYAGVDCDIMSMVKPITKYAYEITKIEEVSKCLIEAVAHLKNGRPGPVWLSVCVDIQGFLMEETVIPIIEKEIVCKDPNYNNDLMLVHNLLIESKRPLIIAGNGIKLGHCTSKFSQFLEKYNIPVVVSIHGTDTIQNDNMLYVGKIGIVGDRAGNFAVQNCDLLISFGCRMAQGLIGYRADWFAREAKIIYIDIDNDELAKENIHYNLKINMDLNVFFDNYNYETHDYSWWIEKCNYWKTRWQFETPEDISDTNGINPYYFLKHFFKIAPENKTTVCSSGNSVYSAWHMVDVKNRDNFIISSQGDMGFELPASIGAQIAQRNKTVIAILGEGSLQMNIQELQTIIHHKMPIKLLIFNNNSYGAIVVTQTNFFSNLFGTTPETGVSFPDTKKIADAYGIKYISVNKNKNIEVCLEHFFNYADGPIICEVFSCVQGRTPKLNAKKNDDGTFTNRPLEDLYPFLDRDEFEKEMIVKIVYTLEDLKWDKL